MDTMPLPVLGLLQRPPKTLDILVYLLEKEEARVSDIMEDLGLRSKTYYAAVRRLLELGFVFERRELGFPPPAFVGLTQKGRQAAGHLHPLSELVESTVLGLKSELEALETRERSEEENRRMLKILVALMDMEFIVGEWDDSEPHAKRALDIASALEDGGNVARSLKLLGEIHHRRGLEDKAEREFTESLRIHMKMNDLGGASDDHYFLGAIKERRGDLEGAVADFKQSLKLAESTKDEVLQMRCFRQERSLV